MKLANLQAHNMSRCELAELHWTFGKLYAKLKASYLVVSHTDIRTQGIVNHTAVTVIPLQCQKQIMLL